LKEVLSQQAYMLFYTSDKSPAPAPPMNDAPKKPTPETERGTKRPVKEIDSPTTTTTATTQPPEKKKKTTEDPKVVATVEQDGYSTWVVEPSNKPFRSLRGDLSPPTFAAAISDISAWHIQDLEGSDRTTSAHSDACHVQDNHGSHRTQMGAKSIRLLNRWTIAPMN
jgi:hypothetical protein